MQTRAQVQAIPPPPPPRTQLVDTKLLSKPQHYDGTQEAWADWSFVFRAYCTALDDKLTALMTVAATTNDELTPTTGKERALDA